MENRAKRELARKRMIIHSVLCAALPPAGMLLVWRSRYPGRQKLLMTLASTLVLTLIFCVALAFREPEPITPPAVSADFAQQMTQQAAPQEELPSEAAPAPVLQPDDATAPVPEVLDDSFIAPANPNG